jgi:nitrogen fixation NifU-like protein
MSDLDLYHEIIIQRNKKPLFYSKEGPGVEVEAYNPVCGDEFTIRIELLKDTITAASFSGYGCAVSKASIDMLLENIVKQDISTAISNLKYYLKVLKMDDPPEESGYNLAIFQRVKNYPARWECATLGATALITFLQKK